MISNFVDGLFVSHYQGGKYDYLHAKYMYNLRNKPASKPIAGLLIGM